MVGTDGNHGFLEKHNATLLTTSGQLQFVSEDQGAVVQQAQNQAKTSKQMHDNNGIVNLPTPAIYDTNHDDYKRRIQLLGEQEQAVRMGDGLDGTTLQLWFKSCRTVISKFKTCTPKERSGCGPRCPGEKPAMPVLPLALMGSFIPASTTANVQHSHRQELSKHLQDNLNVCMSFSSICKYLQVLASRSQAFPMCSQENGPKIIIDLLYW